MERWLGQEGARTVRNAETLPPDTLLLPSGGAEAWKASHLTNAAAFLRGTLHPVEEFRAFLRGEGVDVANLDRGFARVLAAGFHSWRKAGWLPTTHTPGAFLTYFADFTLDVNRRIWLHKYGLGHSSALEPVTNISTATLRIADVARELQQRIKAGNDLRHFLLDPDFLGDGVRLLVRDLLDTAPASSTTSTCN